MRGGSDNKKGRERKIIKGKKEDEVRVLCDDGREEEEEILIKEGCMENKVKVSNRGKKEKGKMIEGW